MRFSRVRRIQRLIIFSLIITAIGAALFSLNSAKHPAHQNNTISPIGNFDAATQSLIAHANRVVFLIPFSHWDTDWHQTFDSYSQLADQNILDAIQLAKRNPRYHYALEQVLFVQHFWDTHPASRADLERLVHNRQITFAWAGITQPETSLVAPSIQVHNLQLGKEWIAQTFGPEYVPDTAWQSDAFGNSAAFPIFLNQVNIPYLYIGRWQGRCDPDYQKCQTLPPAFYWKSPAASPGTAGRVLVTYISYPTAWGDIYQNNDPATQLSKLRGTIESEFKQTNSKYLFLPVGFDFYDPQANLPALVNKWNAGNQRTVLVISDPLSAFQYLATQPLPEITTDLNPIWQAFYDTRPEAKIADKESEYYLTAADKFGRMLNLPMPAAWNTAAINAHYDNISGVSYDSVWQSSQQPRFEQAVAAAQNDLANILYQMSNRISAPVTIFNPTSWTRSEVMTVSGSLPDLNVLPKPVQVINANTVAFFAKNVPSLGYKSLNGGQVNIQHPARTIQAGRQITLTNGLVSVTMVGDHGGTFSQLAYLDSMNATAHDLLTGFGDDITYFNDSGDVYGAFFGQIHAQESKTLAQISVLAQGPLIAQAQAVFTLGGQQVIKTVTVRANDPLIEVDLAISTLPNTTAVVETPTILSGTMRTDDLGFDAFAHSVDPRPITPGDVTYRRSIFYPIMYWSDNSNNNEGLTLITHGLQGVAGTNILSFMLVREVTSRDESVTDPGVHHLRYAYFPHSGNAMDNQPWQLAYEFNQPLIATWHVGQNIEVDLPFDEPSSPREFLLRKNVPTLPLQFSILSAQNAVVTDLFPQGNQIQSIILNYDPTHRAALRVGTQQINLPSGTFITTSISPSHLPFPLK